MPHIQPHPKKSKKWLVIILLLFLVITAAAGTVFMLYTTDNLPLMGSAPTPTFAEGPAQALSLSPVLETPTESGYRDYFKQAIGFAKENGINTLLFEGKTSLATYWRDATFPAPATLAGQDSFFKKLDPLALLCEEAAGSSIQIWVSVNPYSADGYAPGMKGAVAELAKQSGGTYATAFDINDEEYTRLLEKSLSRLPHKYPIAGIVFTGLHTSPQGTSLEPSSFNVAFSGVLRRLKETWAKQNYQTTMMLAFIADDTNILQPETVKELVADGTVKNLLPMFLAGGSLSSQIETWGATGAGLITDVPAQQGETVLFTTAAAKSYAGAVLGNYPAVSKTPKELALLKSTTLDGGGTLPTGFTLPQTLGVQFPTEGQKIGWAQVYITGSSNPATPLYIDGTAVENRSPKGTFGVLVPLVTGNNTFTFTQEGQQPITRTIVKPEPSTAEPRPVTDDNTKEAEPGQAIRFTPLITSALTDPGDDSSINETFYKGGIAIVASCVQTRRYNSQKGANENTWAYRLTSGDYVLARNCAWVDNGQAAFTGLTATTPQGQPENSETLVLEGSGTPAAYTAYNNDTGTLKITLYNTTFTLPEGFTSKFVSAASLNPIEGGVELLLTTRNVWGYQIQYDNGTTSLYVKGAPTIADNAEKPLTDTVVMLDAGHGGTDPGAYGILNTEGFQEKDVNLQLAQATAYRLRQLGATVLLTRQDDSFPSLDDRLNAQMTEKPDFFLAIHHDAVDPNQDLTNVQGIRSFYFSPYSRPPAKQYAENLLASISTASGREGSAKWGYYYVTRTTICPSVLFEYGFLNNPVDFGNVTDVNQIYATANATADAILQTVQQAADG